MLNNVWVTGNLLIVRLMIEVLMGFCCSVDLVLIILFINLGRLKRMNFSHQNLADSTFLLYFFCQFQIHLFQRLYLFVAPILLTLYFFIYLF
jgi:hypothetical protein